MKDRDGNTPEPGWVYRWKVNGLKYEVKGNADTAGLYFLCLKTDRPAQLKMWDTTLAQMERVK